MNALQIIEGEFEWIHRDVDYDETWKWEVIEKVLDAFEMTASYIPDLKECEALRQRLWKECEG